MATTKEQILNGINRYTPLLKENLKDTFVSIEGGKGLSTEDFTTAEKVKLNSVENNAEENAIDFISVNGQVINPTAGKVVELTIPEKISVNGAQVDAISVTGADFSFDSQTKVANISISGGLNSVSITGGAATLSGGDLTIEIDSQTDENFTTAEKVKLNSVENSAQENVIEKIYFNGVELSPENKAVSISAAADIRQNPNFAVNPSAVTLQAFDSAIVTVSSSSPALWQSYSTDADLKVSVSGNEVTLKSGATGVDKNVSCNFYQLGTQNFKDAYFDLPVEMKKLDALKGKFTFDDTLADSSGSTDVTWTCNDSANVEFVTGVNGKAAQKINAGGRFYFVPTGLSIGDRDFTLQFWAKEIEGSQSILDFRCPGDICFILNHGSSKTNFGIYLTNACVQSINVDVDISADFHHYAYVYNHENQTAKFFFDGVCKYTKSELTISRVAVSSVMLGNDYMSNNAAFDNLEIYDGLALYDDDFTPDR